MVCYAMLCCMLHKYGLGYFRLCDDTIGYAVVCYISIACAMLCYVSLCLCYGIPGHAMIG